MATALESRTGESERTCVCGGRDFRLAFLKNGMSVWRCSACLTGHVDPAGFDARSYYTADYFDGTIADGYADYTGSASVLRAEFRRAVDRIRANGVGQGRLLEIGCAYGYFLEEARRYFEVHGVEIAEDAVADCHRRGLASVQAGVLTESMVHGLGELDVVVLLDVIEHLPDPRETLRLATSGLQAGGIVALTTGDFGSLVARVTGANWRLMTPPQHLWFFTVEGIRRCAASLGLEVVEVAHPWRQVPMSLIAHQALRMLGLPTARARSIPSAIALPLNLFDAMRVILRKPAERVGAAP